MSTLCVSVRHDPCVPSAWVARVLNRVVGLEEDRATSLVMRLHASGVVTLPDLPAPPEKIAVILAALGLDAVLHDAEEGPL